MNNCAVIPIYLEEVSLKLREILCHNLELLKGWDVFFICPADFCHKEYERIFPQIQVISFEQWAGDIVSYNKLLLDVSFYKKFIKYTYMLITQTDVFLLKPISSVEKMIGGLGGYVGAPWFTDDGINGKLIYRRYLHGMGKSRLINKMCEPRVCKVGNGGLSLRHISMVINLLRKYHDCRNWSENEDLFFGYFGLREKGFIPPVEVAQFFSLELKAKEKIKEGIIPFGVHAWERVYPDIKDYYDELSGGVKY